MQGSRPGVAGGCCLPPPGWGAGASRRGLPQKPAFGGGGRAASGRAGGVGEERREVRGQLGPSCNGAGQHQSPLLRQVTQAGRPSWSESLHQDIRWGGNEAGVGRGRPRILPAPRSEPGSPTSFAVSRHLSLTRVPGVTN